MESRRSRLRAMAVAGLVVAVAALAAGFPKAALGVLAGMPVGAVNYWLTSSSLGRGQGALDPRASARLMQRNLLRQALAVAALVAAAPMGIEFLLGVLAGVVTEMLTYFWDAAREALGRKG
ncbi:MAG: ATP synthase subunit I [Firmicutes bacterium]|nr:ATP synthase subunit I [Bacillota bacterium]